MFYESDLSMLLHVVVAISLLRATTASLVCLYCTDAVTPANCGTVINCGSHEQCYVDAYVSAAGSLRYNLGCRDKIQCNALSNLGNRKLLADLSSLLMNEPNGELQAGNNNSTNQNDKISHKMIKGTSQKRANGFLACSECCSGDLCGNNACGNIGYTKQRGPICYQCDEQNSLEDCSKIRLCGQGEVCLLEKVSNPITHAKVYRTKCIGENACLGEIQRYRDLAALLIGRRQTVSKRDTFEKGGSCIVQCCKTDLCNINCKDSLTSPTLTIDASSTVKYTRPYFSTNSFTMASTTSQIIPSTTQKSPLGDISTPFTHTHTIHTTNAVNVCRYKSKIYKQGEVWQDGCQYNCTCEDARTGFYRCQDLCPVWNNLPAGCTLEKQPGECCSKPICGASFCVYKGKSYRQGDVWQDGCQYNCTCDDASLGIYTCRDLCLNWTLPPSCHLDPAPAGKCCQVQV